MGRLHWWEPRFPINTEKGVKLVNIVFFMVSNILFVRAVCGGIEERDPIF